MTQPPLHSYLTLAQHCADAARQVILPHFRRNLPIISKDDDSPVTKADKDAEKAMRAILSAQVPQHAILGEEEGTTGALENEWLWVLDPIDGTRSFVTGRPSFTTLIALLHNGTPVLSLIDQPITNERWLGLKGETTQYISAHLPGNIGTRSHCQLEEAELSCTAPEIFRPENFKKFQKLQQTVRRTTWGGDAYGYGLLSLGQVDIIAEDTLKPWDWAALVPVIEGAGGCITDWSGAPLTLQSEGDILACANQSLLTDAVKALSS